MVNYHSIDMYGIDITILDNKYPKNMLSILRTKSIALGRYDYNKRYRFTPKWIKIGSSIDHILYNTSVKHNNRNISNIYVHPSCQEHLYELLESYDKLYVFLLNRKNLVIFDSFVIVYDQTIIGNYNNTKHDIIGDDENGSNIWNR